MGEPVYVPEEYLAPLSMAPEAEAQPLAWSEPQGVFLIRLDPLITGGVTYFPNGGRVITLPRVRPSWGARIAGWFVGVGRRPQLVVRA